MIKIGKGGFDESFNFTRVTSNPFVDKKKKKPNVNFPSRTSVNCKLQNQRTFRKLEALRKLQCERSSHWFAHRRCKPEFSKSERKTIHFHHPVFPRPSNNSKTTRFIFTTCTRYINDTRAWPRLMFALFYSFPTTNARVRPRHPYVLFLPGANPRRFTSIFVFPAHLSPLSTLLEISSTAW